MGLGRAGTRGVGGGDGRDLVLAVDHVKDGGDVVVGVGDLPPRIGWAGGAGLGSAHPVAQEVQLPGIGPLKRERVDAPLPVEVGQRADLGLDEPAQGVVGVQPQVVLALVEAHPQSGGASFQYSREGSIVPPLATFRASSRENEKYSLHHPVHNN